VEPVSGDLVYMNDLHQFVEDLAAASSREASDVAEMVTHAMGEEVARLAYLYAPKDTHELANSITAIHSPGESRVVATAPHAAYVEFGTWSHNIIAPKSGTYTIRPKNAQALRFTGKDGRVIYTRKVEHPGIKAQPFLGRANAEVIENFTNGIGNVGVMLVMNP
jgi:hypothetical protein